MKTGKRVMLAVADAILAAIVVCTIISVVRLATVLSEAWLGPQLLPVTTTLFVVMLMSLIAFVVVALWTFFGWRPPQSKE